MSSLSGVDRIAFSFEQEAVRSVQAPVVLVVGMVLAALALVAVIGLWRSSRAAKAGQAQLTRAESDLLAQRVQPTHQDLLAANQDFRRMRDELHTFPFGIALAFWRAVPLVRVQVRAVDDFADVGVSLSQAGLKISDAAATIERPSGEVVPLSASLIKLRAAQATLQGGVKALDAATARINALNHYRLLGPIGQAHRDAAGRLNRIDATVRSADQAMSAFIAFTGGNGSRQYLPLSQNPDEVRPHGRLLRKLRGPLRPTAATCA
ncbi:MAG: hypothetical protein M3256_04040 [Actinomycetota bacterium]|nr:hypothetical protein [Actinomycetota bacterium]